MRHRIVTPVLCVILIGLGGLFAWGSEPAADPGHELVSIQVRDASVQDVVETLVAASGANIVLDGVDGKITLNIDNLPVERVLDIICEAKGIHWWRSEDGVYFMSPEAKPSPSAQVGRVPGVSESAPPERITRMHHLQYMPPTYIAYLFGQSDDPGPMPFQTLQGDAGSVLLPGANSSFTSGSGGFHAAGGRGGGGGGAAGGGGRGGVGGGFGGGAGGGGGFAGQGALAMFLPEDIDAMIAFPPLNALMIHGTEEGINKLIELLKLVDRKPQQIIVELQQVAVSKNYDKQFGIDWFYIAGSMQMTPQNFDTGASFIVSYQPPGTRNFAATLTWLLESGRGRIVRAIRVATMNLLPAYNTVSVQIPWVTVGGISGDPFRGTNIQTLSVSTISVDTSLSITPRINGDGTITMYVPFSDSSVTGTVQVPTENGNIDYPIVTTQNLVTAVNVRDGETFVVGGSISKDMTESERKVPLLGDMPIIGQLFTRKVYSEQDAETLIFITPRIIKEEAAPATLGPI